MRQFATAWDGVALEIRQGHLLLYEDGAPVSHPTAQHEPSMADLRALAWQRALDRWCACTWVVPVPIPKLEWKTYP